MPTRFRFRNWGRFLITVILSLSLVIKFDFNLAAISTPQLVPQAQRAYQLGNYTQAIQLLEQARQAYQNQPLPQAQVIALTSLAQQQLDRWQPARENIDAAFVSLDSVPSSNAKTQVLAQIWNIQGHYFFSRGQYKQALSNWQQAEQLYRGLEDSQGISGTLMDLAQALEKLGFYSRSCDLLLAAFERSEYRCENLTEAQVNAIIKQASELKPWQLDGLSSLANSFLLLGKLEFAQKSIEASQSLMPADASPLTEAKILLGLGNIHKAIALIAKERGNLEDFGTHSRQAIKYFRQLTQQSAPAAHSAKFLAQLNQLSLSIYSKQWLEAKKLATQIQLPQDSRRDLYGEVKFANNLSLLKQQDLSLKYSWQDIAEIYLGVIKQAQSIEARRIESYAWGYLGTLHQDQNLRLDYTPEELLEQALVLAQAEQAPEIAYRWQWQLGRIYRQQGQRDKAIAVYETSLANLNDLRSDLAVLDREVQFNFTEQVEPVHRELVDLLLTKPADDADLEKARNVIEALQVAQLDNYFQDACTTFKPKSIDQIDSDAAVIYTIMLPQRLEVIMATTEGQSNPHQVFHHHTQVVNQQELEQTIQQLRQYIIEPDRTREVQQLSARIYAWLLKPLMAEIRAKQPKTLVFVLDGMLQTIPMSVLYDGSQYLIEQYAIALTPGLRLLNPQPGGSTSLLAGGISKFVRVGDRSFAALASVDNELNNLDNLDNSVGQILLNEDLTGDNLLKQLNSTSASRLHLATHGQFDSDPQKSFLLVWQKTLTIKQFSTLLYDRVKALSNPLDLLVLSACDTALGDRRAALGLAGIAVRSGSLSTLATLWQVQDDSTAELMKYFYQQLESNGKAEALRQAQLMLWEKADRDWRVPAFWAAYVTIGNWQ